MRGEISLPAAVLRDPEMGLAGLRVLLAIRSLAPRGTDIVYASRRAIAEHLGHRNAENVSKVTGDLVARGWLRKLQHGRDARRVGYQVTVPSRFMGVAHASDIEV